MSNYKRKVSVGFLIFFPNSHDTNLTGKDVKSTSRETKEKRSAEVSEMKTLCQTFEER